MQKKQSKQVLGRGLQALIEEAPLPESPPHTAIPIAHIVCNPCQPRQDFEPTALQELSDSIKLHGIIQPLTVRKITPTQYQLLAGERRLRAAKLAGLAQVPVYIRTAHDEQLLEIALVENIQREDLNPIEIALSYQRLLTECQLSPETLGERVGKNRATVTNYLRLLKLPAEIQIALREHTISMGHARALIPVEELATQLALLKRIRQEGLSVRKVEALVHAWIHKKSPQHPLDTTFDRTLQEYSTELAHYLGTQVKIQANTKKRGAIKISFDSPETLHKILARLAI